MIIKKNAIVGPELLDSCERFAERMKVTIVRKKNMVTLNEAIKEDDDIWFDLTEMDVEHFDEFIKLCIAYGSDAPSIPTGILEYSIDCPNCHKCIMTPKQMEINSIKVNDKIYTVCINCSEIIEVIQ